jgi:hypothetical protein
MITRAGRNNYINSLRLNDTQKNKFRRTNLNTNTIKKVVNAVRGSRERNVQINGILNALLRQNRGPLNSLLNEYNKRPPAARGATSVNNLQGVITPQSQPTPAPAANRKRRIGAGFSEGASMSPGDLYEFFQLMKEYKEKKGNVTRPNAPPMPILEKMYEYKTKMCQLARYPYTGNIPLFRDKVDLVRSLCANEGGNYINFPTLNQPNIDKTIELMNMCRITEFEKLMNSVRNNTGTPNTYILIKINSVYDRFLRLLKDVDAEVALRLYVKDQSSQNLKTYIQTLSPNIQRSLTENVSNDYRLLINKLNKRVGNKKHNPIPVAVYHGPANHNTLSVASMKKILRNPDVIKNFTEGSLFLKYLNEHIPSGGTGGCKMRGDVDGCLLRRRVVFGKPYPSSSTGVKAIQTAISAINHGRIHRLKTFSQNGNRLNRVGEPKKNFTTFDILKKYMNTMKNKSVRNIPLFTSPTNKLLELQKGERVAVKFNGTKLVKFDGTENPHILWTTFGLHLDERGKAYNFFDFINFIYDRDNGSVRNIGSYMRLRGKMGMNYIIQLDSKTLDYLHNKYFFTKFTSQEYKNEIIEKLTSCRG